MNENITGKRIKDLCRQKGITVRELAEKSNTTEVSMIRIITEARMPNAPTWRRSGMKVMLDDGAYMPERAHEADERTRGARRRLASGLAEKFHVGIRPRSC